MYRARRGWAALPLGQVLCALSFGSMEVLDSPEHELTKIVGSLLTCSIVVTLINNNYIQSQ